MKPVKDIFSSHIDSLYTGHEVEAPASIQGTVFKNLDAIKGGASGGLVSGGFSSKAVLGAACVIVGFAWYLMPVSEDQIVIEDVVIIEEVIIEEPVIEEPVIEEAIPVVPFIEDSSVEIDVVEAEVDEIAPVQTIVSEPVVEPAILVQELEPATEPVIIVEEPVIDVVKVKETQEPKEVLEWVLPAKLEVD